MFTLSIKRLTVAASLVAIMALQMSGGAVRYLCDCSGVAVVTAEEHCHGEHGEAGPLAHAPVGHDHDHDAPVEGSPAEDHHHDHLALDASEPGKLPSLVTAPALRLLPVFQVELTKVLAVPADRFVAPPRPPRDDGGPPPTSLLVTRSVVRLI
jgi:hypothetical protein